MAGAAHVKLRLVLLTNVSLFNSVGIFGVCKTLTEVLLVSDEHLLEQESWERCTVMGCKASFPSVGKQNLPKQPKTHEDFHHSRLCCIERQPSLSSFEEQMKMFSYAFMPHLFLLSLRLASREMKAEKSSICV